MPAGKLLFGTGKGTGTAKFHVCLWAQRRRCVFTGLPSRRPPRARFPECARCVPAEDRVVAIRPARPRPRAVCRGGGRGVSPGRALRVCAVLCSESKESWVRHRLPAVLAVPLKEGRRPGLHRGGAARFLARAHWFRKDPVPGVLPAHCSVGQGVGRPLTVALTGRPCFRRGGERSSMEPSGVPSRRV